MLPSINSKGNLIAGGLDTGGRPHSRTLPVGEAGPAYHDSSPSNGHTGRSPGSPAAIRGSSASRAGAGSSSSARSSVNTSTGLSTSMDVLGMHLSGILEHRRRLNERVASALLPTTTGSPITPEAEGLLSGLPTVVQDADGGAHTPPAFQTGALFSATGRPAPVPTSGAAWGVSEGGLDGLGWVRRLVRLAEKHPVSSLSASPENFTASTAVADPNGNGFKRNSLLKSNRREDVMALQSWLEDMMKQVKKGALLTLPGSSYNTASAKQVQTHLKTGLQGQAPPNAAEDESLSPTELADGALHVYSIAAQELRNQVSSECKERGELLGVIWEQFLSLMAVRADLLAEERLAQMQKLYAEAIRNKEHLKVDVKVLEQAALAVSKEKDMVATASATQSRSLAVKLGMAKRAAVELDEKIKVADVALKNEVLKRFEATGELESVKELMKKSELEWMKHRAENAQLVEQLAALAVLEDERQHDLRMAQAEVDAAHAELRAHLNAESDRDLQLALVKHEFKTNEILVMSLNQVVKEQEDQLNQLKNYSREQAVSMGGIQQDIEILQDKCQVLDQKLIAQEAISIRLEMELSEANAELVVVSEALRVKTEELITTAAKLESVSAIDTTEIQLLVTEVGQLTMRLEDTQFKLTAKEMECKSAITEVDAAREIGRTMALTLRGNGAEGTPLPKDRSWNVMGSMGGLQRTLIVSARQLNSLFKSRGTLDNVMAASNERLDSELTNQKQLQKDIYEARSNEAESHRLKNEVTKQLELSEKGQLMAEEKSARMLAQATQMSADFKALTEEKKQLKAKVDFLTPYEEGHAGLVADSNSLKVKLYQTLEDLMESQMGNNQLTEANEYMQLEVEKMLKTNHEMTSELIALNQLRLDLQDMTAEKVKAEQETAAIDARLEEVLSSHSGTSLQLQTATMLLKGVARSLSSLKEGDVPEYLLGVQPEPDMGEDEAGSHEACTTENEQGRKTKAQANKGAQAENLLTLELLHSRGHCMKTQGSRDTWHTVKSNVLTYFSNMLRHKLKMETERRMQLEVDILLLEVQYLEEARAREELMTKEFIVNRGLIDRLRHDTFAALADIHNALPEIFVLLRNMEQTSSSMGGMLKAISDMLQRKDPKGTQTDTEIEEQWITFIDNLPPGLPKEPLSQATIIDTIVRIYVRQIAAVELFPVHGAKRQDTIYDSTMSHFQSLHNTYNQAFFEDPEGPLARLLRSCVAFESGIKVSTFCFFLGISSQAVHWSQASWHFFIYVLHSLQVLLGGTWRSTVRQWATVQGAAIPIEAAYDVLGNMYNIQSVADLECGVAARLAALTFPGLEGHSVVDLDALLMLLVNEFNEGTCPRHTLIYPRRVTVGELFKMFNTHTRESPYADAGSKSVQRPSTGSPDSFVRGSRLLCNSPLPNRAMQEGGAGSPSGAWQPQVAPPGMWASGSVSSSRPGSSMQQARPGSMQQSRPGSSMQQSRPGRQ